MHIGAAAALLASLQSRSRHSSWATALTENPLANGKSEGMTQPAPTSLRSRSRHSALCSKAPLPGSASSLASLGASVGDKRALERVAVNTEADAAAAH